MRKLGWYAVSAVVVALILGGMLLLGANLYVQSLAVQQRIRQALASSLKMPVSVRKTTITPWDGLRIDGIVARIAAADANPSAPMRPNFLTAESFRVRFGWLPLLRRQFEIREVLLDHPELAWPQNAEGRWQFPPQPGIARIKGDRHRPRSTEPTPAAIPAPAAGTPPAIATVPKPERKTDKSHELTQPTEVFPLAIGHIKLRHGSIDMLDSRDRLLGHFEEVNVDGHLPDPLHATGAYWFEKAQLPRVNLLLTKFGGNFAYVQDTELSLAAGHGDVAGGSLQLSYHLQMSDPGSPFTVECQVKDVSLERLFAEAGVKIQPVAGRLQGSLTISGLSDDPASREAVGRFQLLDTHLKDLPLLEAFGEALRIEDLSHLRFKKAELDCELHGTTLDLAPLVLESGDFQISGHGQYRTDEDRLDLHGRLVIDQAVSRQLPQFIESNFSPCGDEAAPGSRFIEFNVTGPLTKPSSNLMDRVLSGPMNGLFENLLAPKPKNRNKKKNPNSEPPVDTPDR